jgi:hypothetical protein
MKIQETIETHRRHSPDGFMDRYLTQIVNKMPAGVQQVFEDARECYCTGELALYQVLVEDDVDPMTAARAAVLFPDPFKFHPHVQAFTTSETIVAYRSQRENGASPLDALFKAAEVTRPYGVTQEAYDRKLQHFKSFIAWQSV